MTRTLLVAGTASHVGKSTVAAGLCRLFADRGVDVAPFKAQNMSNNARAVPRAAFDRGEGETAPSDGAVPDEAADGAADRTFGEIGVSQYVQARAARVPPSTDHNPVLLKPRGEGESQLVVDGAAVAHYGAGEYFAERWSHAREAAENAHGRLAANHDVVVAEGAGSIAEINLHHRDLANVETARFADAEILLVADIERGGVFASLVGTLELLPGDIRDRVIGALITKFRGDVSLLDPGLREFEELTGVPVLGVLPHDDPGLPEEDSLALPDAGDRAVWGADDGVSDAGAITVAVPTLPRISNFTDLEPLAAEPGVRVAYVPLDDDLRTADAVIVPGTKNSVDDLLALRAAGFDDALRAFDGPIVGLCGGYQILGERIVNADVESAKDADARRMNGGSAGSVNAGTSNDGAVGENREGDVVAGVGLLPVETAFDETKRVVETELDLTGAGPLCGADCTVAGYEIHMGETRPARDVDDDAVAHPFSSIEVDGREGEGDATSSGRDGPSVGAAVGGPSGVVGTYLHGLFENGTAREAFIANAYAATDRERPAVGKRRESPYDRAADLLREHVDLAVLEIPSREDGS